MFQEKKDNGELLALVQIYLSTGCACIQVLQNSSSSLIVANKSTWKYLLPFLVPLHEIA